MKKEDAARSFWNRVDDLWCGKPLKDLALQSNVDYVLFLNWRTKHRLPDVISACHLSRVLSTTVEHLVLGVARKLDNDRYGDIIECIKSSPDQDLELVRRVLRIPEQKRKTQKNA